jgi:hypothetical protein
MFRYNGGNIRGRPLSMKISSPKAINWTLKQYGYIAKSPKKDISYHFLEKDILGI